MSNQLSKKRGIRFLFLLLITSFFLLKFAKGIEVVELFVNLEKSASVCTTCDTSKEEKIIEEDTSTVVFNIPKQAETGEGDVLGIMPSLCRQPVNVVNLERKICSQGSYDIHHETRKGGRETGGAINTENIAKFELTMVTYPLSLWLGPYVTLNSNREIRIDDPSYSSSGEWEGTNVQKTLTPQESGEFSGILPTTERQSYEVSGQLKVGADVQQVMTEGIYNIDNVESNPESACAKSVSLSDFNVGGSNFRGDVGGGYSRQQIPGGDNYDYEKVGECLNRENIIEITDGLVVACDSRSVFSVFEGLFKSVFSADVWNGCNEQVPVTDEEGNVVGYEYPDECLDPRNLMVEMTPIFGEVYDCVNGICSNSYLTYSYLATLAPFQASMKKEVASNDDDSLMYFLSTQCWGKVYYKTGDTESFPVKCLWDATPLLMNYKLQAKDKIPNQYNFPDWDSYMMGVQWNNAESAAAYGLF